MTEPGMARERRRILMKVAPLLEKDIWEAVLSDITDLILAERAAAREEGRRERAALEAAKKVQR